MAACFAIVVIGDTLFRSTGKLVTSGAVVWVEMLSSGRTVPWSVSEITSLVEFRYPLLVSTGRLVSIRAGASYETFSSSRPVSWSVKMFPLIGIMDYDVTRNITTSFIP